MLTVRKNFALLKPPILLAAVLFMGACAKKESPVLTDDNVVLAKVGGEKISAYDLQLAIGDNLGEEAALSLNEEGREKLLESLIASKAMAQLAQKEANAEDAAVLEKRVAAYREQLLVKSYLKAHATIAPVTSEMVEDYYKGHPEKFGAVRIVEYELIQFDSSNSGAMRERMLQLFDSATTDKNWRDWADRNRSAPLKISYAKQRSSLAVLPPAYAAILRSMSIGQTSDVFWIDGKAIRCRVNAEEWTAPKPLADVSADIRKMLAPIQLKESLKATTEAVLKSTNVERLTQHQ